MIELACHNDGLDGATPPSFTKTGEAVRHRSLAISWLGRLRSRR